MAESQTEPAQRRRWWRRKPKPVYVCEICKGSGVERRGIWDYCPRGHTYVGARADLSTPPGTPAGGDSDA